MWGETTEGVERQCGFREAGGLYAALPLGPNGTPVEAFFYDEPVPVPPALSLPARGMVLMAQPGTDIWHLVDLVGEADYPNPAWVYEEVKRYGVSRRVPTSLLAQAKGKLDARSRLFLAHNKALVTNGIDLLWEREKARGRTADLGAAWGDWITCRFHKQDHPNHVDSCAEVWWHLLAGQRTFADESLTMIAGQWQEMHKHEILCRAKTFWFSGHSAPDGFVPAYTTAFFASFPFNLELVSGPDVEDTLVQLAPFDVAGLNIFVVPR